MQSFFSSAKLIMAGINHFYHKNRLNLVAEEVKKLLVIKFLTSKIKISSEAPLSLWFIIIKNFLLNYDIYNTCFALCP